MNNTELFLIDGSSFLYRAYHALKPMHTKEGIPVNAVYGFCRMLKKLIDQRKPAYLIVVWDSPGKTERHGILPTYKAKRLVSPHDLHTQKDIIQDIIQHIGIYQLIEPGYEADDLMASAAQKFRTLVDRVVLVTTDKDLAQIVDEEIVLYDSFKEEFLDVAAVTAKFGVPPYKLPIYFALVGDTSDNIPGAPGIGPKTAIQLVQQVQSLNELYERIDAVASPRVAELIRKHKDLVYLSEELFRLRAVPITVTLDACAYNPVQWQRAGSLFARLNFTSLLKDIKTTGAQGGIPFAQRYGYTFTTVTTEDALKALCIAIRTTQHCAVDTECTGTLHPYATTLVGISFCYQIGSAYYLPIGHTTNETQLHKDLIMRYVKPVLEDTSIKKYLHNAKFDILVLSHYGITVRGLSHDTMLAASLVSQDGERVGLKFLSTRYFNEEMTSFTEVLAHAQTKTIAAVPIAQATDYAAADAHQTCKLVPLLQKMLVDKSQVSLYTTLELPLIPILCSMEQIGMIVDTAQLKSISVALEQELQQLTLTIEELCGVARGALNLNSPKQLEKLLFYDLKLTPLKKTSGKTAYSTDQEVLTELARAHPVPRYIIRYRELFKLKSTYVDALPAYVNPDTQRIHTNFSQVATATGRLASSDPNLQNIPASGSYGLAIRSAFIAPPGHTLLSADYSQIELRVLAYFSQDPLLVNAFLHNHDIHVETAARLFEVAATDVTQEQRQLGKRINFSILYGLSPYGLSKDLNIPYKEAERYIEKYFSEYAQVALWMDSIIAETKEHGYVTTLYGRRRYIPGIYEKNKPLYEAACRVAINTKAQGTAAEIMKQGMINVDNALHRINADTQLLLQIHDELLLAVALEQITSVERLVTHTLESVVQWNVPLHITTRTGNNWGRVSK